MASAPKRRVFYSFYYKEDSWRASQVRNIGVVEGNRPATDNDWEEVKRGGDVAIARWIRGQMKGKSCTIVLVGTNTAQRKWIDFEIRESWKQEMGIVGVHINGLKDEKGHTSKKGSNPFSHLRIGSKSMSSIVECYTPSGSNSREKYAWIEKYLSPMVEEAIQIRNSQ